MIYSIDWTIAAVALPHMQGTFSATQDQIAWVMTSYIVVSAIALPTTGWLSATFGRKRLFLVAIGGFTIFSFLCGAANTLQSEIAFRAGQGCFGAYLHPAVAGADARQLSERAARPSDGDVGPRRYLRARRRPDDRRLSDRPLLLALGVLCQRADRHHRLSGWCNLLAARRYQPDQAQLRLDRFLALAVCLGSFQLMLDRGERLDWFESSEIRIEAGLCLLGLYFFVVHALSSEKPIIDLRLMADRNYALGLHVRAFCTAC